MQLLFAGMSTVDGLLFAGISIDSGVKRHGTVKKAKNLT